MADVAARLPSPKSRSCTSEAGDPVEASRVAGQALDSAELIAYPAAIDSHAELARFHEQAGNLERALEHW